MSPSEFVRWARKREIPIPWFDFAEKHCSHFLPEGVFRPSLKHDAQGFLITRKMPLEEQVELWKGYSSMVRESLHRLQKPLEPRKQGRNTTEERKEAYRYAIKAMKEDPKRSHQEVAKEAVEKYFPEKNQDSKKREVSSLVRKLAPSGEPVWAKRERMQKGEET